MSIPTRFIGGCLRSCLCVLALSFILFGPVEISPVRSATFLVVDVTYGGSLALGCGGNVALANSTTYPPDDGYVFTGWNAFRFGFDFNEDVSISSVAVDQTTNSGDYAREIDVCYSDNGTDWTLAGSEPSAVVGNNDIIFTEQTARYWMVASSAVNQWTHVLSINTNASSHAPTPTPAPTHTPTATATSLPLEDIPAFPAWCPTEAAPFGYAHSRTWMRSCGCVSGAPHMSTPTPTTTPGPTSTHTRTPGPGTPTLVPTRTRTSTVTPRPTATGTSYFNGSSSVDAALTATAHVPLLLTGVVTTPTPISVAPQEDIDFYCTYGSSDVREIASFAYPDYVDTVCLPTIPGFGPYTIPEGATLFGGGVNISGYVLESPEVTICLERYNLPRIQFVGIEIPLEAIFLLFIVISFFFNRIGKV